MICQYYLYDRVLDKKDSSHVIDDGELKLVNFSEYYVRIQC